MRCSERRHALRATAALLALSAAVMTPGCALHAPAQALPPPPIVAVADWGGSSGSTGSSSASPATQAQRITHITLHHQGETWRIGADVPAYLRRLQQWSRNTRQWADIPYHYVIAPDGRIYAARPLAVAGDTNTEYDPRGHALVMLLGNFEDVEPTPEQLQAAVELMAHLAASHGLDASHISSHKDHSAQTVCPGRNLYRYLENGWLRHAVAQRLQGAPLPARP